MKKKTLIQASLFTAVCCLLLAASSFAEVSTTAGAAFRLRHETWDNLFNMQEINPATGKPNNDDNYFRLKSSVWLKSELDKQYAFYVKLTNEARYFMDTSNTVSRPAGLNKDEIVFDNLNVGANGVAGLPVDVIVGRQDLLTYGEGFLIMDGTPEDGSRTFYFDAVKAVLKFSDTTSLDLISISDQFNDRALPSLYSNRFGKRKLNTTDDEALVAYGRSKVSDNLNVEPYYIYKREQGTAAPFAEGANAALKLNTVGARAMYTFGAGWKARGEYAHQFGKYENGDKREGDGGYAYIGRKYEEVALKPSFDLGFVYLSGDNPNTTTRVEAWDPLYSRWPWLSELYVLTLATESKGVVGYWSNLQAYRANVRLALDDASALDLNYIFLRANQNTATGALFSASGKNRGQLIQAKVIHKFSKSVDGYFLLEDFVPGNYYAPTNRDNAMFVRWELQWKI